MEATQCSGEVREALYCQDCEFKARMESLTLEGTARRAAPILRPENGQREALYWQDLEFQGIMDGLTEGRKWSLNRD